MRHNMSKYYAKEYIADSKTIYRKWMDKSQKPKKIVFKIYGVVSTY